MYESDDRNVSHPNHYLGANGIEVIEVIEGFTAGLSGMEAVDTANAIKYILRWKHKNGVQDIEKAIWYLTDLKERLEVSNAKEELNKKFGLHKCKESDYATDGYLNKV